VRLRTLERERESGVVAGATGAVLAALALGTVGCGGGLPLLHPAQVLAAGDVRAEAGFSGTVAVGDLSAALNNAQADAAANGGAPSTPGSDPTFAKGALVEAAVAPGLAPIGGARVGIGHGFEGGLVYTGRAFRADIRRAFNLSPTWAISLELGGMAALYGHQDGGALPNVTLWQLHGWGADVPLLLGYQSDGGLYSFWVGARGGGEYDQISDVTSEPKDVTLGYPPVGLTATRFWGGAVVGLAVGFRHVHVAMELDAAYSTISGSYDQTQVTVSGFSLAPATALWWDF
jgi:hypothetical protein